MSRRHIAGLVVEPGAHTRRQDERAGRMRGRLAARPDARHLEHVVKAVYGRSGIERRHFELADAQLEEREDWYLAVNEACVSLGGRTLERLFAATSIAAGEVDAFVCVSSSFSGFPSLSRRLQAAAGLPARASSWDLAGLGCAGPTQALALADMLLGTGAARTVLVLALDVMGSYGALRRFTASPDMAEVVAHCLASDGAAAMLLTGQDDAEGSMSFGGAALLSDLWVDALADNDLTATADNQPRLSVGAAIRHRVVEQAEPVLATLRPEAGLVMHPGGAALLDRIAEAYPARAEAVAASRAVLVENGNLGAPSALWVLERSLRTGIDLGRDLLLFALGPGIVTTALRLSDVEVRSP